MSQRCSFCRAEANQVEKIIYGPHFNICSDCIRTCLAVLDGEPGTGWTVTTSPQRCGHCDRRPTEGYRHVMNRATHSPRICERCIRSFAEALLRELPTLENELQAIIEKVFDPDGSHETSPPPHSPVEDDRKESDLSEEESQSFLGPVSGGTAETLDDRPIGYITNSEGEEQATLHASPFAPPAKSSLKKPKGVLFDLGDTLISQQVFDPEAGTAAVLQIAHNPRRCTVQDIHERLGKINRDLVPRRELAQVEFHPHIVQRHVFEAMNITFDRGPSAVEKVFWQAATVWDPEPGVQAMLEFLRSHDFPLGIVSNAAFTGSTLWEEIERQELSGFFRFLMSSADYWVRKPHPLLMETAASKLGFEPAQVWFVGNSAQYDIAAAHSVGMGAVWYNPHDAPCDGPDPHVEVKSWEEFTVLVQCCPRTSGLAD